MMLRNTKYLSEEVNSACVIKPWGQDDEQIVQQQRLELQIEMDGFVIQFHISHLKIQQ